MYALLFSFPLFGLLLFSVKWLAIVMNTEQCYVSIQMVRAFAFMLWICVCSWRRACVTWKVHFLVAALYNVFTWKLITFIEKLFSFRFCFFFLPQPIPCCDLVFSLPVVWYYYICTLKSNEIELNECARRKGHTHKNKNSKEELLYHVEVFLVILCCCFFHEDWWQTVRNEVKERLNA